MYPLAGHMRGHGLHIGFQVLQTCLCVVLRYVKYYQIPSWCKNSIFSSISKQMERMSWLRTGHLDLETLRDKRCDFFKSQIYLFFPWHWSGLAPVAWGFSYTLVDMLAIVESPWLSPMPTLSLWRNQMCQCKDSISNYIAGFCDHYRRICF